MPVCWVIQTHSLFTPVVPSIDAFPIAIHLYLFMSFYFSARTHIILISTHSTSSNPLLYCMVLSVFHSYIFLISDKNIVSSLLCSDKRNVIFLYGNYSVIHINIQEICFLYWKDVFFFFFTVSLDQKRHYIFNIFFSLKDEFSAHESCHIDSSEKRSLFNWLWKR